MQEAEDPFVLVGASVFNLSKGFQGRLHRVVSGFIQMARSAYSLLSKPSPSSSSVDI